MNTNGDQRVIKGEVVTASIVSNSKGQYTLQLNPTAEVAALLPTGRINFSEGQLTQLAGKLGLSNYRSLLIALGKGGCTVTIPFEFCQAGEVAPDNPSIVYTEDWWKADKMSAVFELSDTAATFVDKLQMSVAGAAEVESAKEDRQKSVNARLQLIMQRNNRNTATKVASRTEVPDDILGKTNDDGADVLPVGAGADADANADAGKDAKKAGK